MVMPVDVISFSAAISACEEGLAVEENIDAASQDAQGCHDFHFDQLQCSHISEREGRALGASIEVAASIRSSQWARMADSRSKL